MEHFLNKLKTGLKNGLPGIEIQYQMAPVGRKRVDQEDYPHVLYKPSAVLILFCLDANGQLYIPLIERKSYTGVHSGQVSFPGGKFEESDRELVNTAKRECFEEIGLDNVEIIAPLTELHIPVSGFKVQPFVGFCPEINPQLYPQEREVESLIRLPVNDLLLGEKVKEGRVQAAENISMVVPYFEVENFKVWGATAMILNELKEILKSVD